MELSVLDIFKIGIGPSSSHTMGPMNAARRFVEALAERGLLDRTETVGVQLYGSLALTGHGHCTDRAVLLGLEGLRPDTMDPAQVEPTLARIRGSGRIRLLGRREIAFDEPLDLLWHRDQTLPGHPNGMRCTALGAGDTVLFKEELYSVGGGFVVSAEELGRDDTATSAVTVPYRFDSGARLLAQCREHGFKVQELIMANERAYRPEAETRAALARIWAVM